MKLNKTVVQVGSREELEQKDLLRWKQMSPIERMNELELNRRACYGAAATGRLQRVLEVFTRK